jgi:multidrug efflux pump subunit AcrA (membrane-fusion protein)
LTEIKAPSVESRFVPASMKLLRLTLILATLVAGGILAVWLAGREKPPERAGVEVLTAARVVEAPLLAVRPVAKGFGVARPGVTWLAIARVSGTVIERHPNLESGAILPAGTELIAIDPTDYQLAIAEAESEIAVFDAERQQLEADEASTARLLEIERDRLALAERELDRVRTLVERGVAPDARLDEQESQTLQFRKAVQELENQLALLPSRRNRLEAELARAQSRLERARRDLTYTTIAAPFDLRLAQVEVERDEFVAAGKQLLSADGIETAEVPAQIQLEAFRRVAGSVARTGDVGGSPADRIDREAIDVRVRLLSSGGGVWPARVIGVEDGLDPRLRTAQVVVAVDDPYRSAEPPHKPPLVKNMYVEVELLGRPLPPMAVVPAAAVHEGQVYVLDADDRLEIRPVRVAFWQEGLAVVEEGLSGGERVVVDDLVPAIAGMRVQPVAAPDLQEEITRAADGAQS